MGSFYLSQRDYRQAAAFYETAIRLQPRVIQPYVNISFAYNALGLNDKAEQSLRRAFELEPKSLEANLNLGLLLGEMGRLEEAGSHLQKAAELDPQSAVAVYNLGVINAKLGRINPATRLFASRLRTATGKSAIRLLAGFLPSAERKYFRFDPHTAADRSTESTLYRRDIPAGRDLCQTGKNKGGPDTVSTCA